MLRPRYGKSNFIGGTSHFFQGDVLNQWWFIEHPRPLSLSFFPSLDEWQMTIFIESWSKNCAIEATLLLQSFLLPFFSNFDPFLLLFLLLSRAPNAVFSCPRFSCDDWTAFWKKKEISSKLVWNKSNKKHKFRKYIKEKSRGKRKKVKVKKSFDR